MKEVINFIIGLLVSFIFVYIIYYFICIKNARRTTKKSSEVEYLIGIYKLDISKFSYYSFVRVVGLVTCFDIALVAAIVAFVDGIVWQILFGFVGVVPVCVISFLLLGRYYKKKQELDNSEELAIEKAYLERMDSKTVSARIESKKRRNKRKCRRIF